MPKLIVLSIAAVVAVSAALYIYKGNSDKEAALSAALECKKMIEGLGHAVEMETKLNVDMSEFNEIKMGCDKDDLLRLRQFTDKDNLGLKKEETRNSKSLLTHLYLSTVPDGFIRNDYNAEIKSRPVVSIKTKTGEILGYVKYSISNDYRMGLVIGLENKSDVYQKLTVNGIDFNADGFIGNGFKSNFGGVVNASVFPKDGRFEPGSNGVLFLETNI